MSLINQMLRDLQQQKKDDGSTKPDPLRAKKMVRVPYLPLPLVLGGATLVLIFFVWWLAGALSDMMFGFEPAAKPAESQQLVTIEQSPVAEITTVVTEDQDQLTRAEREAESPSAPVASAQVAEIGERVAKKAHSPVNAQPVQTAPPVQKSPAAKTPVIKQVAVKSTPASPHVTKKTPPVKSYPVQAPRKVVTKPRKIVTPPRKVVAKVPKRLHPDALPGAILSSSRTLPATQKVARRTAFRATTPYGMAEEAFLDGKWALEQQRSSLAVSSLQHALELYPGHLPARELLVEILDKDGKTGEAMFLLAEGLEIAPDYIVFKKSYARLLVDQGDYDAAAKVMLYDGLPTVEEDPEAHVVLASLYQRLGESFLAAQTYRNLLVTWPQTGAFWVGLGGALEGQNLPGEAVECYQKALKTKNLRQDLSRYAKKRLSLLDR